MSNDKTLGEIFDISKDEDSDDCLHCMCRRGVHIGIKSKERIAFLECCHCGHRTYDK